MEDVKCTLVLYFNDMTTLKRVPTLLEQDCILSPFFLSPFPCVHFLSFFLQQEQEALAHQQPRNQKKKELKEIRVTTSI